MKKLLIAAIGISASLALAYYVVVKNQGPSQLENTLVEYVPNDTLLFLGGLKPFPMQANLAQMSQTYAALDVKKTADDLRALINSPALADAAKLLLALYIEYLETLEQPDTLIQSFGFKAEMNYALYTIGSMPVLRFELGDSDKFKSVLDRVAQKHNIPFQQDNIKGISFHRYALEPKGSNIGSQLMVSTHNQVASFAISTSYTDEMVLPLALGLEKPNDTLAASNELSEIQQKYGFVSDVIGYLNHEEIVRGITNKNSNRFGQMLSLFEANKVTTTKINSSLDPYRTANCEKELTAIAATWPRTVFGYTSFSFSPLEMVSSIVVESTDVEFLSDFQSIEGYSPEFLFDWKDLPIISIGLGLNVDKIAPFLQKTWSTWTQKPLNCEPLVEIQSAMRLTNPAMSGMVFGMMPGLQGIGAGVFDLELKRNGNEPIPTVSKLSALVSVSAENPQALFSSAAMFVPTLSQVQLPSDGKPVSVPLHPMLQAWGIDTKIALLGKHLVLFTGDEMYTRARQLLKLPLSANGIYHFSVDYKRYFKYLKDLIVLDPASATSNANEDMIRALESLDMKLLTSLDITDAGIEFTTKIKFSQDHVTP